MSIDFKKFKSGTQLFRYFIQSQHHNKLDFIIFDNILRLFIADEPAKGTAAHSSDDMCHLGDVIVSKQTVQHFRSQIKHSHADKCERYLAAAAVGKGIEKYHHKRNSACPQKSHPGEEDNVDKSRNERCEDYHYQQALSAVFFFQHRSYQQYYGEIAHKVGHIRMAQHMGEHSQIKKRVGQRSTVNRKEPHSGALADKLNKQSCPQRQQCKCKCYGRIVCYLRKFHCLSPFGCKKEPLSQKLQKRLFKIAEIIQQRKR